MTTVDAARPMTGKTCMVTGATAGIGRVTARALAEQGAAVIVVGRNPGRCEATVEEIKEQTGNPGVEFLVADLSSQQEVRHLAKQFKSHYGRLDVLVNNAGAVFLSRQESADGTEMTFALNHLGYFLLTNLLLDVLKASAPSRIVNVSSEAHQGRSIHFDKLAGKNGYGGMRAYGQSKLANLLFTYELARRLEGTGVTVNALHPGFVATDFGANNLGVLGPWLKSLVNLGGISVEAGAQTSIYLATSPEVEGITGQYFVEKKAIRSSRASYDRAAASRLWEVSEALTGLSTST